MDDYTFSFPIWVEFGSGSSERVGDIAATKGWATAMLVTDRGIIEAGILDGIRESLDAAGIETAVRHSRHYDLSVQFITQTGGEFALTPEARTIANLCSMTLIHRVDEAAGKLADWFGLTDRQVDWVRSATAGNDQDGFSEALLNIDEAGWFPLRVRASEYEAEVIDSTSVAGSSHTA